MDAFFASVEIKKNSALAGIPLIVGGSGGRGVVTSCSYEARRFGIHAGMPMAIALRRCPDARTVRGDYEDYEKHSGMVTEIIAEEGPVFEKASIDEFYLDMTGMDRHVGCVKWSGELRQRIIRETGLPISAGLAINKLVSKVRAGEAKPNGSGWVADGAERAFPLSPARTEDPEHRFRDRPQDEPDGHPQGGNAGPGAGLAAGAGIREHGPRVPPPR